MADQGTAQASIIDRVYAALVKLHARTGRPGGKGDIHRALGCEDVTPGQVYEALRSLRALGKVDSPTHGLFEPAPPVAQDRAFSLTDLPGGGTKLEIGDTLVEFSPSEMVRIALYFAGHAKATA